MIQLDVAAAYDAIAQEYDRAVHGDAWMRRRLWEHFDRVFEPGDSVLDIACGTGTDDLYLAERGIAVTAFDASPGMLARLRQKLDGETLPGVVDARVMAMSELADWPADQFDGAISSFAGLSTEPDLVTTAVNVSRVLRPGAHFVVHLLNQFSLWEWLGEVAHGRWLSARNVGRATERTFPVGGRPVVHYLYQPNLAYLQHFSRWFILRDVYGLGILRPPHTVTRIPQLAVAGLERLDRAIGSLEPFRRLGRFFVLDLERR